MKNLRRACLVLCFICLLSIFIQPIAADQAVGNTADVVQESDVSITNGCHSLDGIVPVMGTQQLIPNMEAAVLFDVDTETIMYAFNADVQMPPASLVKIMTALLAIEKGNLSDIVEVKKSVTSTVQGDAISADLQDGEKITLENLIYCMMVKGANDAAAVIADHISGNQDAFVAEMNRYAVEIGCKATKFSNPHGLHADDQLTTARDIAKILFQATKNPKFEEFFSTVFYTVPATNLSEARYLASSNYLMNNTSDQVNYYDGRVTGGRTGVADDGKRCLAATAQSRGRKLISVVMGSKSVYAEDGYSAISFGSFSETSKLFTMGFDGYKAVQILYDGQVLRQSSVVNGENGVVMGPHISAYTVLPENVSASDLVYRYFDTEDGIVAPIESGQKLSHVQVWNGNICVAQADLFAVGPVRTTVSEDPQVVPGGSNVNWYNIIMIVFTVVGGIFVILIGIRIVQRIRLAALRKRGRRYRKSRRRSR